MSSRSLARPAWSLPPKVIMAPAAGSNEPSRRAPTAKDVARLTWLGTTTVLRVSNVAVGTRSMVAGRSAGAAAGPIPPRSLCAGMPTDLGAVTVS